MLGRCLAALLHGSLFGGVLRAGVVGCGLVSGVLPSGRMERDLGWHSALMLRNWQSRLGSWFSEFSSIVVVSGLLKASPPISPQSPRGEITNMVHSVMSLLCTKE